MVLDIILLVKTPSAAPSAIKPVNMLTTADFIHAENLVWNIHTGGATLDYLEDQSSTRIIASSDVQYTCVGY